MGAANPSTVAAGGSTLLTVAVTNGTNPTSTGVTVTGDLSSIGGSATQQFFDNGTNGDVTGGDNIFSFSATVAIASPGAPPGAAIWIAFAIGQIYILLRHYVKLLFYASQTAYFQSALAHAAYTASPTVVWPESPAAETIGN